MTTPETIALTAGVSVAASLLGRHIWDRWQAADKVGKESRDADNDLRVWMEAKLGELRSWMEGQFKEGREQFAQHDTRLSKLETTTEVTRQLCEMRHSGTRVGDSPSYNPSKDRCNSGEREP